MRKPLSFRAVVVAVALAGCSSRRSVTPIAPIAPVASCSVGTSQPSTGDTLVLATFGPIDRAHVPVAANAAERLAFAQVYETLIDVDCDGAPRPGLAASWTFDATRTRITLTLRDGARFGKGKPVGAGDVLAAWQATGAGASASASLAREIARGTTVIDDHTLMVSLPDTDWLVLANPALAVYEPESADQFPSGTGPYRIAESSPAALMLVPTVPSSEPYLQIRRIASGDPRDAIDAGADVVVTGDPATIAYAATRANLMAAPLPWTRTYALVLSGAAPRMAQLFTRPDSEAAVLRSSLAHDAVHAEARAAQPPYWWDGQSSCGPITDSVATRAPDHTNRVVYRRDDGIARGLAERLVALDPSTVAAGLPANDFASALTDGGELAYVLELPRASLSPCDDLGALRSAAPWLVSGDSVKAKLVQLIDTRNTAMLNRQRVSATVDWRGTLRFGSVGNRP